MDTALQSLVEDESRLGSALPIMITRVVRFEGQPRMYFDPAGIEQLAASIQKDGQQIPVKVCKHPSQKGMFVLIDGERRLRAFQLIHKLTGHEPTISAFIAIVKDVKEQFRLSMLANMHRKDLTDLEEAAGLFRLHKEGETLESLAALLGKSITYIQNRMKVHTLPEEVKAYMDPRRDKSDRLTITSAIDIASSTKDPKLQIELANEIMSRSLDVADGKRLIIAKTGNAGYRPGGRLRKPSDDYNVFSSFLGRTDAALNRLQNLNLDTLYRDRDDPDWDKKRDISKIDILIEKLRKMKEKIAE